MDTDTRAIQTKLDLARLRLAALERAYTADISRHREALADLADRLATTDDRPATPSTARAAIAGLRRQLASTRHPEGTP